MAAANPAVAPSASIAARPTGVLETTRSTCPRIMQLVTMICTNRAMRWCRAKAWASIAKFTSVVNVAITSTKQGSRTSAGISPRTAATKVAEPTAFATVLETASSGHKPSSCAHAGLRRKAAAAKTLGARMSRRRTVAITEVEVTVAPVTA